MNRRRHSTLRVVVLCILAFSAGTFATAYAATNSGPRYTLHYRSILNHHSCQEDEYLFIPAKRVNNHVNYNTPIGPFCINRENVRKAGN